jgi:hypothetical protein
MFIPATTFDSVIMAWYLRPGAFSCRIIGEIAPRITAILFPPCNRTAGSTELETMEFISLKASGYEVGRCQISVRSSLSRTIANCAAP